MKKFYIMFLVLIIALAMIVPTTIPVAADNPPDKKPVAWATWGGDVYNPPYTLHDNISLLVKKWSDGSITGHFTQKFGGDGVRRSYGFHDVEFTHGEPKIVDILTDVYYHPGLQHYLWWRLKDAGEPGVSDTVEAKIWVAWDGEGFDLSNFYPGQWVPGYDPLDPSYLFNPSLPLYVVGVPAWYPWMPNPSGEMAITNGNIQIHIKD
ncbi:MAG: hypothetical protein PVJ08_06835 [Dehalococcoidia bacterium]|jgi:hypothetical protein